MSFELSEMPQWLFGHDLRGRGYLAARWLFLRSMGLWFFSAFYSLVFQIRGLMGPQGVLPAKEYLADASTALGPWAFRYVPTVLWLSSSNRALLVLCWVGMIAAALLTLNFWPRGTTFICLVAFLSFVSAAQEFSGYQSEGMLLEAGVICLFFAPPGFRPGWGESHPASRASRWLLLWLWFRIYFESGVAKILGHDPSWRDFTAIDQYYQNGPLPTWIGWYAEQFPHAFQAAMTALTLALELGLVFAVFLPRKFRIILFWIVTPWQIGIILTSNYCFLNFLVLSLGILLLDDEYLSRLLPKRLRAPTPPEAPAAARVSEWWHLSVSGVCLTWLFIANAALLLMMWFPESALLAAPARPLEPFRFANQFGLFGVMTTGRYEIEFQGSNDGGNTWTPYPFRYKPQDVHVAPGIYAPYQPRFEWNLWFASLGNWRQYPFVPNAEIRLLEASPDVLALFARNPFPAGPPQQIRAVIWQYWFTDWKERRAVGAWWKRQFLGLYAPQIEREPDGRIAVIAWPRLDVAPVVP